MNACDTRIVRTAEEVGRQEAGIGRKLEEIRGGSLYLEDIFGGYCKRQRDRSSCEKLARLEVINSSCKEHWTRQESRQSRGEHREGCSKETDEKEG